MNGKFSSFENNLDHVERYEDVKEIEHIFP
jgi:hypothetical protein